MNTLCLTTENKDALNQIYNTACGNRTTLLELVNYLKKLLSLYNDQIEFIPIKNGDIRDGDIPHSLASINKAKLLLKYNPKIIKVDLKESIKWYYNYFIK